VNFAKALSALWLKVLGTQIEEIKKINTDFELGVLREKTL